MSCMGGALGEGAGVCQSTRGRLTWLARVSAYKFRLMVVPVSAVAGSITHTALIVTPV